MPSGRELLGIYLTRTAPFVVDSLRKGDGTYVTNSTGDRVATMLSAAVGSPLSPDEEIEYVRAFFEEFPGAVASWADDLVPKLEQSSPAELASVKLTVRPSDRVLWDTDGRLRQIAVQHRIFG